MELVAVASCTVVFGGIAGMWTVPLESSVSCAAKDGSLVVSSTLLQRSSRKHRRQRRLE
jgi:hypothetical protein